MRLLALVTLIITVAVGGDSSAGRPIQLIHPNEDYTSLQVNEEALKVLEGPRWSSIKKLVVISAVGRIHTGKSFLLNQIIGDSSTFKLGRSVDAQTQG